MKIHASHCPRTAGAYDRIYLYHFSTLVDSGGSTTNQKCWSPPYYRHTIYYNTIFCCCLQDGLLRSILLIVTASIHYFERKILAVCYLQVSSNLCHCLENQKKILSYLRNMIVIRGNVHATVHLRTINQFLKNCCLFNVKAEIPILHRKMLLKY